MPGTFIGARRHTQVADIAMTAHLAAEKAAYGHGGLCLAQADLEKFYDTLAPLLLTAWLRRCGDPLLRLLGGGVALSGGRIAEVADRV